MVKIIQGDCLTILQTLPDESVNCCVTSPPYWGLRSYGTEAQVWGGDPKCEHQFSEYERMRQSGGDGTASAKQVSNGGSQIAKVLGVCGVCGAWRGELGSEPTPELFIKHLVMVFAEVRRVLRKDGTAWVNMGDSYSNYRPGKGQRVSKQTMQESNGSSDFDDCSRRGFRQEGLKEKDLVGIPWMLAFALRANGWYLRQDIIWSKTACMPESVTDRCTKSHEYIFLLAKSQKYYFDQDAIKEPVVYGDTEGRIARARENHKGMPTQERNGIRPHKSAITPGQSPQGKALARMNGECDPVYLSRNKRSVWTVGPQPYKQAHFATFPPNLIRPCILAGCPTGGTVLDPFGGSGTTGMVSEEEGRNSILIELNPKYVKLAEKRTAQRGLFCQEDK